MEVYQFDKNQYLQTMTDKMIDITESTETLVDVWKYAEKLLAINLLSVHDYNERFINAVYANGNNSYHHVLLFGKESNIFIVIIINVLNKHIDGYYILDLNDEYG